MNVLNARKRRAEIGDFRRRKNNIFFRFWEFLKADTWQSWLVSLILAFIIIKFVFFPSMSLVFATPLPLVVVESCSMYHSIDFDTYWERGGAWYEGKDITEEEFREFPFSNGLNKGDIILVSGRGDKEVGDIIVFNSDFKFPLIHRVVEVDPDLGTKGDNPTTNPGQLSVEKDIDEGAVLGRAVARIPGVGWAKLIFFEGTKPHNQRGFCR